MKKLLIIMPAYNEEKMIAKVIASLPKKINRMHPHVLVVDDGSKDKTLSKAKHAGVHILRHPINLGLGGALATGFAYAIEKKYDYAVTFDADGQHHFEDLLKIVSTLCNGTADVVIGSRLLGSGNMPFFRKIVNWISNVTTYLLFGVWTTDSQSGLRGFTKKALNRIRIRSQKMEVSSEIMKEIYRNKLSFIEVRIKSIYTPYSLTKGQAIGNAPNVFWKLLLQRFM